ncbi:hypothetical protein DEO23_10075 [Brachybacterium endophyticum]|uniref:ATP-grasp domain-containing protein n=1 Tax=Brachybacterium endophyticum TaxID=2182385 RepID=A0A2U2RJU9_9MICO|nr:ATP-grasp domain-containing protein [Brachybacterium endophyticum]PWH06143.1 hypothetical protein DEO23_10075 [Brachybacterium endophyticum]
MTEQTPTVVIGSAGRRLYLIDWFRDAFTSLGLEGRVVVTENDPSSASASYGDLARMLPRYDDPAYGPELLGMVDELRPGLFITANDYELMHLHVTTDLAQAMRERGVLVPGVSRAWQRACADKLLMAQLLTRIGVPTPVTVAGGDTEGIDALRRDAEELVVKHRLGSGSSGLAVVPPSQVESAVRAAARTAPTSSSSITAEDAVIVQPKAAGVEHGVDLVGDLTSPGVLSGVLARRKLRMRAGETDKAVTVGPEPFLDPARRIAEAADLAGLIDVDMFLDGDGAVSVIDINPRFGGGYPFVHLAGADVPRYCVARAFGLDPGASWQEYETGVVSAKHESVRVTTPAPGAPGAAALSPGEPAVTAAV